MLMTKQNAAEPTLEIEKLELRVGGRNATGTPLVDGADLALGRGRIHALVGESGSGKTLMARSIVRLLPPGIRLHGGSIRFKGRDLTSLSEKDMQQVRGKEIGFVFQEPMLSLNPAIRIGEQMAEGMRQHLRLSPEVIRDRSVEMLQRVSIRSPEQALQRFPHEFSGGMRQRIMLASVLALGPALLIADEPTTALDAIIQRDVLDIMTELTRELGTSVLLITHDLGLVAQYAEDVTVMQRGRVMEAGPAAEVIRAPQNAYTRNLLAANPQREERAAVAPEAANVLRVDNLVMCYQGPRTWPWCRAPEIAAVRGVSLSLRAGETLAVVGESGSGKTTIGRAVMGLRGATEGRVEVAGVPVDLKDRRSLSELRKNAQIVFQDPASSLDPRHRVEKLVDEGLTLADGLSRVDRHERVVKALDDVGLGSEFLQRYPHELSGGQRQRVAIARAIILSPKLIVADEPVSALDVTVQAQVLRLLSQLQEQRGFAYLFISHDLGVVEQIADRVLVMKTGRIVEMAPRDSLYLRPTHPYTRRLLEASVEVRQEEDGTFSIRQRSAPPPGKDLAELPFFQDDGDYSLFEVGDGHQVALSGRAARVKDAA